MWKVKGYTGLKHESVRRRTSLCCSVTASTHVMFCSHDSFVKANMFNLGMLRASSGRLEEAEENEEEDKGVQKGNGMSARRKGGRKDVRTWCWYRCVRSCLCVIPSKLVELVSLSSSAKPCAHVRSLSWFRVARCRRRCHSE